MKIIKQVIKWGFYSLLLLVAGIAGFTYFYGDTIKQFVLSEINKYVVGTIHVSSVDFTLIDNFPDASLEFKNVIALSSNTFNKSEFEGNTDTLLIARSIYLQFDVIELLKENYTVKAVRLDNSKVSVYQDKNGGNNYQLFKESKDSVKSDLQIKLNNVKLKKVKLAYQNSNAEMLVRTYVRDFNLNGNFVANDFDAQVSADAYIDLLRQKKSDLIKGKDLAIDADVNVYKQKYLFKSAEIAIDEQLLDVVGELKKSKFGWFINIDFSSDKLDVEKTLGLIPYKFDEKFYQLNMKGTTEVKGTLAGYFNREHELTGDLNFTDLSGSFEYENKRNYVSSTGMFSANNLYDIATYRVLTDTVSLKRGTSTFQGRMIMKDFSTLGLSVSGKLNADLSDVDAFIPAEKQVSLGGRFEGKLSYSGKLKDWDEMTAYKLKLTKIYLSGKLNQAFVSMPKEDVKISSFKGTVNCDNKDIKIDQLVGVFNGMNVAGELNLANGLPYSLFDNQELIVAAKLETGLFDFHKVFPVPKASKQSKKTGSDEMLPEDISARIDIKCNGFKFDNFSVNSLQGQFTYSKRRLYTRNLKIEGLGGTFDGSFDLEPIWGGGYVTKGSAKLNHLDLNKLFFSCNNFGQEFLQDKNLGGFITADVKFKALWDKNFEIKMKSVFVDADLKVEDGKLVDFEPLNALSSFVKLEELKTVQFKTLENHILIKDEVITIPQMDINSSLYNMTIDGTQNFNSSFKYILRLSLNEVMAKKFKSKKREKEYFGEIEDDGLGRTNLFLTISGTPDDFKVSYNTKKTIEVVKDRIKKEGKTIKEIFKKEFGSKKKDTAAEEKFRVLEDDEQEGDFEIEFDF